MLDAEEVRVLPYLEAIVSLTASSIGLVRSISFRGFGIRGIISEKEQFKESKYIVIFWKVIIHPPGFVSVAVYLSNIPKMYAADISISLAHLAYWPQECTGCPAAISHPAQ